MHSDSAWHSACIQHALSMHSAWHSACIQHALRSAYLRDGDPEARLAQVHQGRVLPIGVQLHRLALSWKHVTCRHAIHPTAVSHQLRRVRVASILLEARLVWMGRGERCETGEGRGGGGGGGRGGAWVGIRYAIRSRGGGEGGGAWVGIRYDPFESRPHRTRRPPKTYPAR